MDPQPQATVSGRRQAHALIRFHSQELFTEHPLPVGAVLALRIQQEQNRPGLCSHRIYVNDKNTCDEHGAAI